MTRVVENAEESKKTQTSVYLENGMLRAVRRPRGLVALIMIR